MAHELTYTGDGNYRCDKCSQPTDRENVTEFLATRCAGDTSNEQTTSMVSEVRDLSAKVGEIEARLGAIERALEPALSPE